MHTLERLQTPLSIFQFGDEKSGEFLASLVGPELAYPLISMVAQTGTEQLGVVAEAYYAHLRSIFPSLPLNMSESRLLFHEHHAKANETVEYIRKVGFPESRNQMSLLNSVSYSSLDHQDRLHRLFAEDSDERFRYELLRQEILMLTSLAYIEARQSENVLSNLHTLNECFEEDLFIGKYSQTYPYECYSIHDSQTNETLLTSSDFSQLPEINYSKQHFKQHSFRVRHIDSIGPVLVKQRHKHTQSALIKAMYKGALAEKKIIDLKEVTDTSGFLFVTEEGKDTQLLDQVSCSIRTSFPEARIVEDHTVDSSRKQSQNVHFLRIQVYLETDSVYPIEFIFFNQKNYFNYTYHLGSLPSNDITAYPDATAHKLYELRRTYTAADILFPQEVYEYDKQEVLDTRMRHEIEVGNQLLSENLVLIPVAHL